MNIGGRVRIAREARGLTQPQLAEMTAGAISQQALSALEKRDSKSSQAAAELADALKVSLRWLLTGQGRMDDPDWPFPMIDRSTWDALSDMHRGYVQSEMRRAIAECTKPASGSGESPHGPGQFDMPLSAAA